MISLRLYFALNSSDRDIVVEKYSGQAAEVVGVISDEPLVKDFTKTFTVKVKRINGDDIEGDNLDINIRIQTERYLDYEYGQNILLKGKLSQPFNFKSNGGRTFDYINFLLKDGIYFEMKKPEIEILESVSGNVVSRTLFKIKQKFLRNIKRVLGEPHAALAGGLVVGEKSALGKDLLEDFRLVGLIHIIVLSGYNITIIGDSIMKILSFLPRTLGIVTGGFGIVAFGILVGGGATVVRSCIMAVIALSASLFRKDYNAGKALFVAGALMLIQNPLILLYDPSFQLSFLATMGLILLSSPIENKLKFITERLGMRSLIASTFATQIFVSPFILHMMGQLSLIGVIVNILVLPIIPLTMLFVALTGFAGFISNTLAFIPGYLAHFLLSYELMIVNLFSKFPFASINLPKFSFWLVVAFYASYFVASMKLPSNLSQFKFKKKSST